MKGKLYRRKRNYIKKVYKKGKSPFRSYSRTKQLVKLINRISLKKAETKQGHLVEENQQLNHNSGILRRNLISLSQGVGDQDSGASFNATRLGDEVIARGIKFKFWIANKADRPNIMYRLIVFRYQALTTPSSSEIFVSANANRIMDDLDTEYITPLYQRIFNIQIGFSANANGTVLVPSSNLVQREPHKYLSFYVPLKNLRIKYSNGGTVPKNFNYGMYLIPYDSFGTLTSDTVASCTWQYKFYFKDP